MENTKSEGKCFILKYGKNVFGLGNKRNTAELITMIIASV
jgi:hypothetical protein